MEDLLADAGFVGGSERVFNRTEGGRRRAQARMLVFEDSQGADRYLAWLEEHADELIGGAERLGSPAASAPQLLVVHEADACCPRATTVYLAAWRRGQVVLTLEVGGQGVEVDDVSALVATLDDAF